VDTQVQTGQPPAPAAVGPHYKWYVLALAALTHTLVMGMPNMSLPVLFGEIGADLNLNLVQIGVVWGAMSLTGIVMAVMGGVLGDRFGARRTLMVGCLIAGVTGALRGFAFSFASLAVAVFIAGAVLPIIPINVHKTCAIWFSARRLGTANGVVSAGMALGFMLGAMLSATVLSPLLGGWRGVMFFYAAIAIVVGGFWVFTQDGPQGRGSGKSGVHLREGLPQVVKLRDLRLLTLGLVGVSGCVQGTLGYLPLYLRGIGWPAPAADATLSLFHATSLVFAIPFAILSDRLGYRRRFLIVAALMMATGVGLLGVVDGALIWGAVILAGMVRDGFMAIVLTSVVEVRGVGPRMAGTATGFMIALSSLANALSPPVGNSLAAFDPGAPFLFWAGLALVGIFGFWMIKDMR
jgi:MFS family permease